jgi:hypothetical protein
MDIVTISMCLDENLKYKVEKLSTASLMTNVPVELEKRAFYSKHIA